VWIFVVVVLVGGIVVGVVVLAANDNESSGGGSETVVTGAGSTTTTIDVAATDPALRALASTPLCRAENVTSSGVDRLSGPINALTLGFTYRGTQECALLSYPRLLGKRTDGTWMKVPIHFVDQDPVSSVAWEGTVQPGRPSLELRLEVVGPSAFPDSKCPGSQLPTEHLAALQFELRRGTGKVEVSNADFELSGCFVSMTHFGHGTSDGSFVN